MAGVLKKISEGVRFEINKRIEKNQRIEKTDV